MEHFKNMKYLIILIFITANISLFSQSYNKIDTNGLKTGLWIEKSDSLTIIGNYVFGKKNGSFTYYKKSTLLKILTYKNDSLSGYSISFNIDGSLSRKFMYEKDKLNGKAEFYSSKGEILAKYEYLNNTILRVDLYIIDKETPPRSHDYTPRL